MREIKFRAWDGKRMVNTGIQFNSTTSCLEFVPKGDLMQYTGLKDKNSVEIYEGDIVCRRYKDSTLVDVIEWGVFSPDDDMGIGAVGFMDVEGTYVHPIEIVGNIYENPELLEKT